MKWEEREVSCLELCKKLKELGFPQNEKGWYWDLNYKTPTVVLFKETKFERLAFIEYKENLIKAPTFPEMLEWFPSYVWFNKNENLKNKYEANDSYHAHTERDRTLPNACAKLLIWLRINNYIEFRKEEDKK